MLRTNRGLLKFILLSLLTFGIYGLFVLSHISEDINQVASPRDNKHTMHFCWILFIFSWLTLGIAPLIWFHRICKRIGNELQARNLPYSISALTFWGWDVLGSLIIIGPFIFLYKFLKSINLINNDYNAKLAKKYHENN